MKEKTANRPLEGIRVVDFSSIVAGPWCTRLLADCGAEVIKVEPVGECDLLRFVPPAAGGMSRVYAQYNAGKKSVSINLKSERGRDIALRLMDASQAVVENFRSGVMKRLGLDYETAAKRNPSLVYCSVSGFGQTGPMSGEPSYAPAVHALSGYDHVMRVAQEGAETPLITPVMIADVVAAIYAFGAVQTALINQMRTGRGAHVDLTLMESMMSLLGITLQQAQSETPIPISGFRPTKAKDGFLMIPLVSLRNYLAIYPIIGRPEWVSDKEFNTQAALVQSRETVLEAVDAWAVQRPRAECKAALDAVGLPCAYYRTPEEVLKDEHLRLRGAYEDVTDAGGGYKLLNPPFKLSSADCIVAHETAAQGADTDAVMKSLLNMSDSEISELREANEIA